MESPSQVREPDDPLQLLRSWGTAVIRVAFLAMVAGWFGLVVSHLLQDREAGLRATVVGATATVVFVASVAVAWRSGWRAVVADRRDPTSSWAVRAERDRRRRRGRTATRWTVAAVCVDLLLAGPVAVALVDLRKPDYMSPRDQLTQFDVAADDAAADAAELEAVLSGTADQIGLDFWTSQEGPNPARCRLPDGSVGTYYHLNGWVHDGFTYDPVAVTNAVAEYWEGLGYSVDEMSYRRTAIFTREMHSSSGGTIYITISPDSTVLSGRSGCSAVDNRAP